MDNDRAEHAIKAFGRAEDAMELLITNADELIASATALRDTDQTLKSLAEALGFASKQWVEVATDLKDLTAEVHAAGKLLQKAEPQELMSAIDETTQSTGELRTQISSLAESVTAVDGQIRQLTSRVDGATESATSLRETLIAKMDLQQASVARIQSELDRLGPALQESARDADVAQSRTRDQILKAVRRNLYAASAAALIALVAVVVMLVQ